MGYSPWGREESDTTERLHFHFSLSCIGEGSNHYIHLSGVGHQPKIKTFVKSIGPRCLRTQWTLEKGGKTEPLNEIETDKSFAFTFGPFCSHWDTGEGIRDAIDKGTWGNKNVTLTGKLNNTY